VYWVSVPPQTDPLIVIPRPVLACRQTRQRRILHNREPLARSQTPVIANNNMNTTTEFWSQGNEREA